MKKVLVIGSCGAGKSTFAKRLHLATGLNLIHLDSIYHLPNWEEPPDEEWLVKVQELVKNDEWIIDGNFGSTMKLRMKHCDTIIWLDFPRTVCIWRIIKRVLKYHGKKRPDMAEGCIERFDWEFLQYVWNFPRDKNPGIESRLQKFENIKIYRLRSNRQVEDLLARLKVNFGSRKNLQNEIAKTQK